MYSTGTIADGYYINEWQTLRVHILIGNTTAKINTSSKGDVDETAEDSRKLQAKQNAQRPSAPHFSLSKKENGVSARGSECNETRPNNV